MPGLVASEPGLKKRKRQADAVSAKEIKARKAVKLDSGNDIKIITWFIAEIDETTAKADGEQGFDVELFRFD